MKNAIATQSKIQNCKSVPTFINWGSFSNREKRLSMNSRLSMCMFKINHICHTLVFYIPIFQSTVTSFFWWYNTHKSTDFGSYGLHDQFPGPPLHHVHVGFTATNHPKKIRQPFYIVRSSKYHPLKIVVVESCGLLALGPKKSQHFMSCPRSLPRTCTKGGRRGCSAQQLSRLEERPPQPRWENRRTGIWTNVVNPNWLVVWTPLKNISQLGLLFPIYGKTKNVPNHHVLSRFSSRPELVVTLPVLGGLNRGKRNHRVLHTSGSTRHNHGLLMSLKRTVVKAAKPTVGNKSSKPW